MIDSRKEFHEQNYETLISTIPAMSIWSKQQFIDAMILVGSRSFGITVNGTVTNVMVPLADMLNHKRPPDAVWTFDNDK